MIKQSEIKPTNPMPRYYNLNLAKNNLWHNNPEKVLTVGQKISEAKKGKKLGPCSAEKAANIKAGKLAKNPPPPKEDVENYIRNNPGCGTLTVAKAFGVAHPTMQRWLDELGIPAPLYKKVIKLKPKGSTAAERWSNPEWAEMMRARLREGSKRRWDSSK